ncbi:chemotaxis protein CheW [Pseudohongiella sp.]|uniref:CheW-like domain-containing protein n=1 Tax=marine sediment metagenome TaxID=412755 RepID=A0A0F9W092_9ZZZZ|nr:chemotaxis protein CheW [Pseudohongiella sp.]HDZ09926.1 chemotaxis protein CheW [Pseudohongiella sp.]HEA63672.1 chemotaxis protein CheW [Pseudohongiella sp.]
MVNGQTSARTTQATASHGVVQDYLDVLLRNVLPDDVVEPEPDPERESAQTTTWADDPVCEPPATLAAAPILQQAAVPDIPDMETLVADVIDTPAAEPEIAIASAASEQVRETAPWADKAFASLLFDVMGLKLAAPLHELGGIMPLADKLQPMAAQADWFMGLIRWNGRTIRVVDTARFVMPERIGQDQVIDYHSLVVLGDSHWALAVNNADQSVHLQPADIRWRKTLGKRPWLAGTVLEHLCALLDVDVLIAMLNDSDTAKQVKADLAKQGQ